ncbi:MAG: hypothetical protein B6I32_08585 [Desulfobacterium sp. 4572_20]|nr:MAG: hypothetical protein B6I32_08585 [Desulfobacterium sp. 4572_20]
MKLWGLKKFGIEKKLQKYFDRIFHASDDTGICQWTVGRRTLDAVAVANSIRARISNKGGRCGTAMSKYTYTQKYFRLFK